MFSRVFIIYLFSCIVLCLGDNSLSQKPVDFWDDTEPFGQTGPPSPNLRLSSDIVPSFYRLKIKADLDHSNFTGEVYITIRASKKVKEIILHSKGLSINNNAKLTEQIYEKVETLHSRRKRDAEIQGNITTVENSTDSASDILPNVIQPKNVQPNLANQSDTTQSHETTSPITELKEIDLANNSQVIDAAQNSSQNIEPAQNSSQSVESVQNSTQSNIQNLLNKSRTSLETPQSAGNVTEPGKSAEAEKTNQVTVDTNTQVTHSSVRNIKILSVTEAPGDQLVLTLATALKPNVDYILEIPFAGPISNSLNGFYKSTYTNAEKEEKSIAVTQFEPTSARAAFPCFDEPGFKAKFEISIAHKKNLTVLSNMNVATTEPINDQPDWEWTHFERSVKMSTYLVAYVLCDFKSLETSYVSKDNVTKPIRIWARPELLKKAEYAASITPKLLEYYEEVFGLPYALDKLDLIAIPDFSTGAMENWGLITFRETTLLFDEVNSAPRDKQNVAIDIAHEVAHQWFGNLVTMRWWTDLWLNEGFATYIEYVGVDKVEPSWNMLETFTRDMLDLLRSDALKNTSPVSRRVVDASEISQKFDEISYAKGANLIRMLNNTMSRELFHKGLVQYLNQWKYANAEENNLWEAMSTAVTSEPVFKGRSLVKVMNSWTRQAGYPVVSVTRNYETGVVRFEQKLFTSSKDPYKSMLEQLWHIPINCVALDAPLADWTTRPQLWLDERSTTSKLPLNNTQALYVNIGAIGYYRVNYDKRNWELLSAALQSGRVQSAVTKAQLIDDAFNLAKVGQLDYSYALGLTTCVINGEDSKLVWDLLLNNMAFLRYNLRATSGYSYFQDFMKILLQKQLERLNYGLNKPKDDNEAFLIDNLVMWECLVESPRCLDWAKSEFDKWMQQPNPSVDNPIPLYLRSLVYNTALKYGGRREFDFLWNMFHNTTDPNVKTLVLTSLPSTREEALITMLLEKSLSKIPKHYAVAVWNVEPPIGTRLAQQFLLNNFNTVYTTFTEMDSFMFPAVLSGAFGFISNEYDLNKLKSFAMEHKEKLLPMSQTLQKLIDTANLRIEWMKQHADNINRWFKDYVTGKTNSTANSTLPSSDNIPPSTAPSERTSDIAPPPNNTNTNVENTVEETKPLQDAPKEQQEENKVLEEPKVALGETNSTQLEPKVSQDPNLVAQQSVATQQNEAIPTANDETKANVSNV